MKKFLLIPIILLFASCSSMPIAPVSPRTLASITVGQTLVWGISDPAERQSIATALYTTSTALLDGNGIPSPDTLRVVLNERIPRSFTDPAKNQAVDQLVNDVVSLYQDQYDTWDKLPLPDQLAKYKDILLGIQSASKTFLQPVSSK